MVDTTSENGAERRGEKSNSSALVMWPLWMEGYVATGDRATARFLGNFEAETFEDACDIWGHKPENIAYYSSKPRPAYWGCRIFDNETEARAGFG